MINDGEKISDSAIPVATREFWKRFFEACLGLISKNQSKLLTFR